MKSKGTAMIKRNGCPVCPDNPLIPFMLANKSVHGTVAELCKQVIRGTLAFQSFHSITIATYYGFSFHVFVALVERDEVVNKKKLIHDSMILDISVIVSSNPRTSID